MPRLDTWESSNWGEDLEAENVVVSLRSQGSNTFQAGRPFLCFPSKLVFLVPGLPAPLSMAAGKKGPSLIHLFTGFEQNKHGPHPYDIPKLLGKQIITTKHTQTYYLILSVEKLQKELQHNTRILNSVLNLGEVAEEQWRKCLPHPPSPTLLLTKHLLMNPPAFQECYRNTPYYVLLVCSF